MTTVRELRQILFSLPQDAEIVLGLYHEDEDSGDGPSMIGDADISIDVSALPGQSTETVMLCSMESR